MENKVIWRIRHKGTGQFQALGYKGKSTWLVKPTAALKENRYMWTLSDYELVKFEYILKEVTTEEIIL